MGNTTSDVWEASIKKNLEKMRAKTMGDKTDDALTFSEQMERMLVLHPELFVSTPWVVINTDEPDASCSTR